MMKTSTDKLLQAGCEPFSTDKICRSRGGESCAFDGAMIVLQPIADAAHLIHGPIACCGNSWEGRGTLSSRGILHKRGFTTDMGEMDIVYGSEDKLLTAIRKTHAAVHPKAIFIHATCVSGLIGEDINAVCKKAEAELGVRVIPVSAPGFVGPKNLGNRIAGEVLLEHVIGTGKAPFTTDADINLIGEYNISGDLWQVEPVLNAAGVRVLSHITGDAKFEEITWAHRAKLNVVVCSRALINVAKEMESRYGIPYVEVSFFGRTEMAKALRSISAGLRTHNPGIAEVAEKVIEREEKLLDGRLAPHAHLRGKKAVLYTGGVKSWSFISALMDLGIGIAAVGTKKSTCEDEEKMRKILGANAPLVEDVTPKNLLKLLRDSRADMLVAGGRNKYLAVKEGYPFIDVNQERHAAYAGYEGLVKIAEDLSNSVKFYARHLPLANREDSRIVQSADAPSEISEFPAKKPEIRNLKSALSLDPLKHSPALGAAIAFQGIDFALPVLHGAQGCTFLGKVLITNHFREPVSLLSSKLFVEDVVMGSEDRLIAAAATAVEKSSPEVVGILTTGLSDVKGDDVSAAVGELKSRYPDTLFVKVATPDFLGGMEQGYAAAVISITEAALPATAAHARPEPSFTSDAVAVFAGMHLTPGDINELRAIIEAFGLRPIFVPDASALDGSREGVSALARGGTTREELEKLPDALFSIVIGASLEPAAELLAKRCGIGYRVFRGAADIAEVDGLLEILSVLGNRPIPARYERERRMLVDGMRDAHYYFGGRRIALALEADQALSLSRALSDMGAEVNRAVVPEDAASLPSIEAEEVVIGDLTHLPESCDLILTSAHGELTAADRRTPLLQIGFPSYKELGAPLRISVGYRGALALVNEVGNLLMKKH